MQFTYPLASIKDSQATGEAFSPQKEHPALQKMKILSFFLFFGVIFALLDRDPDPQYVCGSGSGSRKAKMTHKNRKKSRIFIGCSLLRAEGFSCSLGVLYGGLGISKLQFLIKKIKIKFLFVNFFQF